MNTANDKKKVMRVGEWNSSRIIFNKGHVEHRLNGEKIVDNFTKVLATPVQLFNNSIAIAKITDGRPFDYPSYLFPSDCGILRIVAGCLAG